MTLQDVKMTLQDVKMTLQSHIVEGSQDTWMHGFLHVCFRTLQTRIRVLMFLLVKDPEDRTFEVYIF
jgi:hypothetical protein